MSTRAGYLHAMYDADSARVRFVSNNHEVLSLLEVETPRTSPGLMSRLDRALFDLRVQVVGAESRLSAGRRLERLSVVEFDGGPIRPARQLEIQVEVLRVLEAARRRRRSPPKLSRGNRAT